MQLVDFSLLFQLFTLENTSPTVPTIHLDEQSIETTPNIKLMTSSIHPELSLSQTLSTVEFLESEKFQTKAPIRVFKLISKDTESFTTTGKFELENLSELSTMRQLISTMNSVEQSFDESSTIMREIEIFQRPSTEVLATENMNEPALTMKIPILKSIEKSIDEPTTTLAQPSPDVDRVLDEFVRRKSSNETDSSDLTSIQSTFPAENLDYDFEDKSAGSNIRNKSVEYYEIYQYYYDDSVSNNKNRENCAIR